MIVLSKHIHINDGGFNDIDQYALEKALAEFQVQPVGAGFSQLIVSPEKAENLINCLTDLNVLVEMVSWWCLCVLERREELGCPHGIGGPQNRFGNGWFSECVQYPDLSVYHNGIDVSVSQQKLVTLGNGSVSAYLSNSLPSKDFYSECLHYGLWLRVPKSWKREFYFV